MAGSTIGLLGSSPGDSNLCLKVRTSYLSFPSEVPVVAAETAFTESKTLRGTGDRDLCFNKCSR